MIVLVPINELTNYLSSIEKINKKADKFGCKRIEVNVGETTIESIRILDGSKLSREVYQVEINIPEKIKINNWEIIAIINHTEIKSIKTYSDDIKYIHDKYENFDSKVCQHCNTKRQRNYQFVLRNEKEEIVVGGSCIKNYIGLNPQLFFKFRLECENCINYNFNSSFDKCFNVEKVIELALKEINENGYHKSFEENPTVKEIKKQLFA